MMTKEAALLGLAALCAVIFLPATTGENPLYDFERNIDAMMDEPCSFRTAYLLQRGVARMKAFRRLNPLYKGDLQVKSIIRF